MRYRLLFGPPARGRTGDPHSVWRALEVNHRPTAGDMRGRCPSVRSETLTLNQPPKATAKPNQIYFPKIDLYIETQSPEGGVGRKYVNMSSKGSDRSELRTRLDCPLANSNCAQSVLRRGWPIRSANGFKRSCRPLWRAATAGLQRVGTIGTAQLLARPGVGSCMPRPHYLRPFAFVAGSLRRWHRPHLPFNLGLAGSATPFLKPAHSGPEPHGTPASVADSCRSAALRLLLA